MLVPVCRAARRTILTVTLELELKAKKPKEVEAWRANEEESCPKS